MPLFCLFENTQLNQNVLNLFVTKTKTNNTVFKCCEGISAKEVLLNGNIIGLSRKLKFCFYLYTISLFTL